MRFSPCSPLPVAASVWGLARHFLKWRTMAHERRDGDAYGDLLKVSSRTPQRKTPSWLRSCETSLSGTGKEEMEIRVAWQDHLHLQRIPPCFFRALVPECGPQNSRTRKMVWTMSSTHSSSKVSQTLHWYRNKAPDFPALCSLWPHRLVPFRRNFQTVIYLLSCCRLHENDQRPGEQGL